MMRPTLLAIGAVAAGCGDPSSTSDGPPGGSDAAHDAAVVDAGPPDATPGTCPAGTLCLTVHPVAPGLPVVDGRLVVVFYQLGDNLSPQPPLALTYDAAFTGTSTSVEIALANIALPTPFDDYETCTRSCLDLSNPACDCHTDMPRLAIAVAALVVDADGSGAIEQGELDDETNHYGTGYVGIAWTDADHAPPVFGPLFPEGCVGGLAIYEPIRDGIFDRFWLPEPGAAFDLDVCVPDSASCDDVRFPNVN